MNKKAITKGVWWMIRFGFLLIPMTFALWLISERYSDKSTDPGSTEYDLLINRIYKTFAYTSPNTGRSYPYIIDQKKFNTKNFNDSIIHTSVGIKVVLNKSIIYFNKEFYEIGKPLSEIKSDYKEILHISPVQILTKDNKIVPGIINMSIIYKK